MLGKNTIEHDLKRYWSIILRRKYVALSVALAVLSVFAWGSFFMAKIYEVSSTVLIEKSSIIDPLIRGVGVSGATEGVSNLRNNITSRNLLEKVMKKVGIVSDKTNPELFEDLLNKVRNNLSIKSFGGGAGSDLFTVSFSGKDPTMITDFVNTLVHQFIADSVHSKVTDASGAYDFIQTQLFEYKKKLEDSDRAIREFRERNPNMIPQSESALTARTENFQSARIEADIRVKELLRKRESLQKQLSGEKELTVAFVTREGSPQARLNALNNQLIVLITKYTDNYPEVIKVKREIEELKRQIDQAKDVHGENSGSETAALNPIYQQLKEEFARTDAEIESLRARSMELSRHREEAQSILGRMPKEQEEWTRLQRDRNVFQKLYDDLLQKLENARVSKDLGENEKEGAFRIVDPAIIPALPIKPNRVRMILLGLFLGIAAGVAAVIGLDYLNQSFKDEASIESGLNLSVLATIPRIITEEDRVSAQRLDRKVFTAAGVYLFVIGLVLTAEVLSRYLGIKIVNF